MYSENFLKKVKLLLLFLVVCYPALSLALPITINSASRGVRSTGNISYPDINDPYGEKIYAEWDDTVENSSTGIFDGEAYVHPLYVYESSQHSSVSADENGMDIIYAGVCWGGPGGSIPDIVGETPKVWNWLNVDFSLSQDAAYFFNGAAWQGYFDRPAEGTISLINSDTAEIIFYYNLYRTFPSLEDIGTLGAGNYLFSIDLYDTSSYTRPNGLDVLANFHLAAVPEPSTILLFGTGLAGLAAVGRRRK